MRKVLIVTPNWPPISCPDLHRVRTSLAFFSEFDWEPLILKINPDEQEGIKDEQLTKTVSKQTKTWQASCLPKKMMGLLGIKSVGLRSLFHLAQLGNQIIKTESPDIIFFSTTMFPLMVLGRYWHFIHGIPYILDFQDPWVSSYHQNRDSSQRLGGRLKYRLSQSIAQILEPLALRHVSHIISVSLAYTKTLEQRYPHLHPEQFSVIPFGAPANDFELLLSLQIRQSIFDRHDGKCHWVYVGRGGNDMALAITSLFLGIQLDRQHNPEAWQSIKLHFVGTSYATDHRAVKTVEPIAQELGIADLVEEYTGRIPYFEALQILVDSDGILLIGSDDPGYTASKLYPCILARKPILAIFHQQSSVVDILNQCQAGRTVTFKSGDRPEQLLPHLLPQLQWLLSTPKTYQPNTDWQAFQPYTAKEMTRQQCAIFDRCLMPTKLS